MAFFIMPFVFTWVLVGQVLQARLTIDKLIKVTGVVDKTREVTTDVKKSILYTHKDVELRIYLKDTSEYFRIMDVYKYERFQGQIKNGDSAEIYIRPKWMVPLGFGYRNDVFQMSINGKTIFDVSQTLGNAYGIIIVSLIAIPLFVFLGKRARRKAHDETKQKAT